MMEGFPKVRVFVASPSDVKPERDAAAAVVREISEVWAETLNLAVEIIRWETHCYPALGTDPQAVINSQIGEQYDVFVGILWSRFGTPTPRAESGTEEEFRRACRRQEAAGGMPEIMLYFKEAQLPYDIDVRGLEKVRLFRRETRRIAVDWPFGKTEEFESLFRTHLAKVVQKIAKVYRESVPKEILPASRPASDSVPNLQELGELAAWEYATGARVSARLAFMMRQMAELLKVEVAKLSHVGSPRPQDQSLREMRSENRAAQAINQFADRLRVEIPTFRQATANSARAAGQVATMISAMFVGDTAATKLGAIHAATVKHEGSMINANGKMIHYRETVSSLPAKTETLRQAQRKLVEALVDYEGEMASALRLSRSLVESIHEMWQLASGGN